MSSSADAYLSVLHCSYILWAKGGFSEWELFQRHATMKAFQNFFSHSTFSFGQIHRPRA